MTEIANPVPLEEVKGFYFKTPDDGGEPVKTEIGWNDLSSIEQSLTTLILEGKYGDAYKLSGEGKSSTYNKSVLRGFLSAVIDQHNSGLQIALNNDSVRNVIGE